MFNARQEIRLMQLYNMGVLSIFRRVGTVVFVVLILVAGYVFTSCSDCLVGEFRARTIILSLGIILCAAKIALVLIDARNHKISWLQILLPSFVLSQLLLMLFLEISSLLVLSVMSILEIAFIVSAVLLTKNTIEKTGTSGSLLESTLRLLAPAGLAAWVMLEITLIYSFLYGLSKFFRVPEKSGWSYWKNSAFPLIFILLLFVGPVEIVVIHFILDIQSTFVHILFILLFIWSLVYVFGFWVSMKLSPHQLNNNKITLNRGALGKAEFSTQLVKSLRIIQPKVLGEEEPKNRRAAYLTVPGTPMVELILKDPVKINQILSDSEQLTDTIIVSVDEPQSFCQQIREFL